MKHSAKTQKPSRELAEELQTLAAEAETIMSGSTDEDAADAPTGVQARLGVARDRLGDLYGTAREKVVAGARSTDTTIRSSPYQTIAVAAGIGLLLGILARRCRS